MARWLLVLALVGSPAVALGWFGRGETCTGAAKKPTKSEGWDPFRLGFTRLMDKERRKVCHFRTETVGRVTLANLRAVMSRNLYNVCVGKTRGGKKPVQRVVWEIDSPTEKEKLFRTLNINSADQRKTVTAITADFAAKEVIGLLMSEIPGAGATQKAVDLAMAIAENSCGAQKMKRSRDALGELIAVGGKITYDFNITPNVNRRGEALVQEVLAYQVKVGRELRVVPLMSHALLVKLK